MVFDPVNAIGLASNLVQLIDFGRKLLCESCQIYVSTAGASARYVELRDAAETLLRLDSNIAHSLQSKEKALTVGDQELRRLWGNCHIIALKLLATLDQLRVTRNKHGK